jgi:hypothetical protein
MKTPGQGCSMSEAEIAAFWHLRSRNGRCGPRALRLRTPGWRFHGAGHRGFRKCLIGPAVPCPFRKPEHEDELMPTRKPSPSKGRSAPPKAPGRTTAAKSVARVSVMAKSPAAAQKALTTAAAAMRKPQVKRQVSKAVAQTRAPARAVPAKGKTATKARGRSWSPAF